MGLKLEDHQQFADAELLKYHHTRPDKVEEESLAKSSTTLCLAATKLQENFIYMGRMITILIPGQS